MEILASLIRFPLMSAIILFLILSGCGRDSKLPSRLDRIPADLRNEQLETQGIYADGWIAGDAACNLQQPGDAQFLTIRGMVPIVDNNRNFGTDLALSIDGKEVGRRHLGPGEFDISMPVSRVEGKRRVTMTFNQAQTLPAGDGRSVGAHLAFVGFVQTSTGSDIVYSPDIQLGSGWGALETFHDEKFRWVENDAQILVESYRSPAVLSVLVEPGSGIGAKSFELKLFDSTGDLVATQAVQGRRVMCLTLPTNSGTPRNFRLHVDAGGKRSSTDPRILNFRVFKIELR
jgi:hypothetical protein